MIPFGSPATTCAVTGPRLSRVDAVRHRDVVAPAVGVVAIDQRPALLDQALPELERLDLLPPDGVRARAIDAPDRFRRFANVAVRRAARRVREAPVRLEDGLELTAR